MSIKKMQKGGSLWIKGKGVFGFLVDGKAKTASIPNIKSEDIVADIRIILKKKRVKIKQYRRIIRWGGQRAQPNFARQQRQAETSYTRQFNIKCCLPFTV